MGNRSLEQVCVLSDRLEQELNLRLTPLYNMGGFSCIPSGGIHEEYDFQLQLKEHQYEDSLHNRKTWDQCKGRSGLREVGPPSMTSQVILIQKQLLRPGTRRD